MTETKRKLLTSIKRYWFSFIIFILLPILYIGIIKAAEDFPIQNIIVKYIIGTVPTIWVITYLFPTIQREKWQYIVFISVGIMYLIIGTIMVQYKIPFIKNNTIYINGENGNSLWKIDVNYPNPSFSKEKEFIENKVIKSITFKINTNYGFNKSGIPMSVISTFQESIKTFLDGEKTLSEKNTLLSYLTEYPSKDEPEDFQASEEYKKELLTFLNTKMKEKGIEVQKVDIDIEVEYL
jgi:hypothetical protein